MLLKDLVYISSTDLFRIEKGNKYFYLLMSKLKQHSGSASWDFPKTIRLVSHKTGFVVEFVYKFPELDRDGVICFWMFVPSDDMIDPRVDLDMVNWKLLVLNE